MAIEVDVADVPRLANEIFDSCAPQIAGKHPGVQGAALARLFAVYLAGHPDQHHAGLTKLFIQTALALIAPERMRLGIPRDWNGELNG